MDELNLSFPITKVDQSRRIVVGIATADNIDPAGDIVTFEASKEAFSKWTGNMREMHQMKAVGKVINFRETKVNYNGNVYDGIEVEAYISKGAEDTWQKVVDGTLRGFSVGGRVVSKATGADKYTGRVGRKITKYDLNELSLVDNPGNPAGLISLIKRAEDGELDYALTKYDVYYCQSDKAASTENDVCAECNGEMMKIGYVEEKNIDLVRKAVGSHLLKSVDVGIDDVLEDLSMNDLLDKNNGDIVKNMDADFTEEQQETFVKRLTNLLFKKEEELTDPSAVNPVNVNIYTHDIEKGEKTEGGGGEVSVEEADDNDESVSKSADDGGNKVDLDELKSVFGALLDEKLSKVKEEISESVDEKVEAIQKSVDEVKASTDAAVSEVSEKVERVESSGALKKSVDDSGEDNEVIEKSEDVSFWGGMFVPQDVVKALGYES